jgi:hypothetical protein
MNETLSSWIAYAGMIGILTAFVLETRGKLSSRGAPYLWLMTLGSGLLALRAAHSREWAFLILEVVWCAAAAWSLFGSTPKAPGSQGSAQAAP